MRFVFREYILPAALFALTVVTTTVNGARFMRNYLAGLPPVVHESDLWPWPSPAAAFHVLGLGWSFSLALLGILLVHEFGHYIACRWHRIDATLPWVLPAPTLSGTIGAVIRIRSRIPHRDALMDVGIYGPLAGYLASGIAVAVGLTLSSPLAGDSPDAIVVFGGQPLTIRFAHALLARFNPSIPSFAHAAPHPVLVAGWIGLFLTSLNLLPGGQLDGGHIVYALSPRLHGWITRLLPLALIAAGVFFWIGWVLWGLILLVPTMRHPRVPTERQLHPGRIVLSVIGAAILCLTFTLAPFADSSLIALIR